MKGVDKLQGWGIMMGLREEEGSGGERVSTAQQMRDQGGERRQLHGRGWGYEKERMGEGSSVWRGRGR